MVDRRLRVLAGTDADKEVIISLLDGARIRIILGDSSSWSQQILVIALVDLLGRLLPSVAVVVDPEDQGAVDCRPGAVLLVDRIRDARANGALTAAATDSEGNEITVQVGQPEVGGPPASLHVDGSGWQSYVGSAPSELHGADADIAIGPLVAACRAASGIITRVLEPVSTSARHAIKQMPERCYASALTYETGASPLAEPTPSLDAIDALLVGAGSVGGASVYALAATPRLNGHLTIIDSDRLDQKNLDRALLATHAVTAVGDGKAEVAGRALAHHQSTLHISTHCQTVTDYHASLNRQATFPLVLAAVDSLASRRAIQDCLPLDLVNAACSPNEIMVSAHRTDDGPCVCCLHMPEVMDTKLVKTRLIADATGFNERMVAELLVIAAPLTNQHIGAIEQHRRLPAGALASFTGRDLEVLWRAELLYGSTPVRTATGGEVVVAAPHLTALAGVLLAGEALKAAARAGTPRLGPGGLATKYVENPSVGPQHGQLTNPPRWPGSECLCRSARRLRILRTRYLRAPDDP